MLSVKKADSFRESLIVVSYGVWQRHGGKKSWTQYQKALGLDDKQSKEVSKEEKKEAVKTSLNIIQLLKAGEKRGNKS